ncbi:MAG TPA: tRNA (adenosine(37)-N6)-threonylcarbamoyltransferase complex dimerization subunit type 1 TsaB [Thermoanaerobaculia bacterium]|nr:tRNA (adenosine(37)-N6)-threonylcarbamoyltransferase complex dimerization subunit type 1 TsaB [Thermoanaerobaculia bacterium]
MNVLVLDAASPQPAVALIARGRVYEQRLPGDRRASEDLLPAVQRALADAGLTLSACERIAVCAGPGSFTGLRVGLATAWGLGRGLGIAVEPVSTLEAMAETARLDGASRVVAVLDAGRGEAVCERFALEGDRARSLGPATLVRTEEVAGFAAGDRLIDLKDERAGSAAAALAAAVSRRPKQPDAAGASAAIYSRPSAAEEKRGAP